MQKISFGNKEYVKASQAAKQFRYTQDYVGQLCRAKKVDARLVGRTWYVELDSVAAYRKNKHKAQKTTAAHISINKRSPRNLNPKPVAPVLRSKTLKATQRPAGDRKEQVRVAYGADSEVAIPVVVKSAPTKILEVKSQNSPATTQSNPKQPVKKIKIKKTSAKKTKFSTEKLPEIALSGKIKVKESLDDSVPPVPEQPTTKSAVNDTRPDATVLAKRPATPAAATAAEQASADKTNQGGVKSQARARAGQRAQHVLRSSVSTSHRIVHSDKFLVLSLVLGLGSAVAILSMASLGQITPASSNSWSLFFDLSLVTNFLR